MTPPSQQNTKQSVSEGRSRARALFVSPDFYLGLPGGLLIGLIPALVPAIAQNGFAFFITLAGISAAVAALVLTPMTMMLGALTPALRALLSRVPGGATGTMVPFVQVVKIASIAAVMSLVVAIVSPLTNETFWWVVWLAAGIPIGFFLWAVIGCVQVTSHLINMYQQAEAVEALEVRKQAAQAKLRA